MTNKQSLELSPSVVLTSSPAQLTGQALQREVDLTPKPGLVDRNNSGAHKDMDYGLFLSSINAIIPFFDQFYYTGKQYADIPVTDFLAKIRPVGIACEQAMFNATKGVNTHKGAIFAFGLFCSVIGRLDQQQKKVNVTSICDEVASVCTGLVEKELNQTVKVNTVGERLFKQFGFTGARGEAASGYATIREIALPTYIKAKAKGYDEEMVLSETLLHLFAYNNDTNVVSRGGLAGLQFLQQSARGLIQQGGMLNSDNHKQWQELDVAMIERNLSPGGSADLLAVTWFLSHYKDSSDSAYS
ncbi:triphosphoribosyl-dephospho-CoA synthase CitG [Zophobihabitans entericus]|uniref:Probable 2-(5''-triphosphoribosyl)-3'-dephosphocoenzyme-A synthase n=1 Tax=Zophobihabitans entericus TaxID=1635327 RepID=A0A6G9I9K4_9GAMM|nr:triphosphoribosyl-dephospho-CoA synthase CitG [Zophobihabitans entericus]QIQ20527.1 triphosphoribosyl-dephospho-CoA synthase CitG [Zophobihabitans entericus]